MPFPANWLEELVVEWLDLTGFVVTTSVRNPAAQGGAWKPDAVGAKLEGGLLLIRHCETATWLNGNPAATAQRYTEKFSPGVRQAVRNYFDPIFGGNVAQNANYERWVITCQASAPVQNALNQALPAQPPGLPAIQIRLLHDFVLNEVLPSITNWRQPPNTNHTELPTDKWLLQLIDHLTRCGVIPCNAVVIP